MTWYKNAQDSIWHGERPAVAGLLLYPDKKEKMETTSESAFCPRPVAERQQRTEKKNMLQSSIQLEGEHSFTTTHREDFRVEDFQPYSPLALRQKTPRWERRGMTKEMEHVTFYQQDFPPPLHTLRKATPAVPHPDNLGINPSLRGEFLTIQKETYPGWAVTEASRPNQRHILSPGTPPPGGHEVKTPARTEENIPHTGSKAPQSKTVSVQT
ncbi:uncharacterized protein si:dkeyp-69c1.9 isoform X1 [Alosa alosa]|uniref:uncharacterized protein si:dkeyp-69c1.9 isoform X1 n=2 Tax=Alosa alosa TaxID=278164 RepID=UPI002015397E|nr:uncharacterized protein si:dkeyp-69c1.9 isoform X1 [Alosa alosa]